MSATQAAGLKALVQQQRVTDYPYYSSVCFRADFVYDTDIGWHYTFARGQVRRAFAYGRGQDGGIAGFTLATDGLMTLCETNLVKPHETLSGQQVQIDGLGIFVKPAMTDGLRFVQARVLAQIATNVSVQFSVNGDENLFPLGTIQQIPAAGGLVGMGNDDLAFIPQNYTAQDLSTNIGDPFPFCQNGWQTRGNYYRLPSGVIWNPAGSPDSMLNVIFTNERAFTVYTGGTPEREQLHQLEGTPDVPFKPVTVGVILTVQLMAQVVGNRTRTA